MEFVNTNLIFMFELNYKNLTIIQVFVIGITGISVFDMGYSNHAFRGIWFNHVLFHMEYLPSFMKDGPFWGEFQLWGYLFLIVSMCQLLKAIPPNEIDFFKFGNNAGRGGIIILLTSPTLAIIINIDNYDFSNQTLSSLVDYGLPSIILMSWGLMIGAILLIPYPLIFISRLKPSAIAYLTTLIGILGFFNLFMIGITLPADEPYNHSIFAIPYWISMTVFIFLSSVLLALDLKFQMKQSVLLGIILSISMLILLIIGKFINIPGYIQLAFLISVQVWHLKLLSIISRNNNSN